MMIEDDRHHQVGRLAKKSRYLYRKTAIIHLASNLWGGDYMSETNRSNLLVKSHIYQYVFCVFLTHTTRKTFYDIFTHRHCAS
jgi:hypothetical protein